MLTFKVHCDTNRHTTTLRYPLDAPVSDVLDHLWYVKSCQYFQYVDLIAIFLARLKMQAETMVCSKYLHTYRVHYGNFSN